MQTNCYLVWDKKTKFVIIIDPGDDGEYIIQRVQDLGIVPVMIVATHGHFDHVCASLEVKLAFNIPFYLHQSDEFLLKRAQESARHWTGIEVDPPAPVDGFLKIDQMINFGNQQLKILHTPGHTPGGVCLYSENHKALFTGDTLFANGGVGRTDFSYSSEGDLHQSINKIFQLDVEVEVYPGHGQSTNISNERIFHKHNHNYRTTVCGSYDN